MDALSLAIPTAAVANPGSHGPEPFALREEETPGGFAALLAAGLLQQDVAALAAMPDVEPPTEPARDGEEASPTAADGAAALAVAAAIRPPHLQHAAVERSDEMTAASADVTNASAHMEEAAQLAAEAATIAADDGAVQVGARPDDALGRLEAAAASEAHANAPQTSTSLAHPLHLGAVERAQDPGTTAVLEVAAPVRSAEFAQSLSQQVVWMADKDAQVAELRLDPPELGPVEVRLQLAGDEASVQFVSAHAEVRSAIEAAIARLRESMAQAGIQLGEASVSAESFRDRAGHHSGSGNDREGYRSNAHENERTWPRTPVAEGVHRGLIDLFA